MEKNNGKHIEGIGILEKRIIKLEEALELSESIIGAMRDPLVVLDADLKIISVNKAFYNTFFVTPDETIGEFIYDLGNRQWDIPKLRTLLEDIIPKNSCFDDYAISHDFKTIGRRVMLLNARRIPRPPAKLRLILLCILDITDIENEKLKMSFEKMLDKGVFTKLVREKESIIVEFRKEVDALLKRLGEKHKYNK
jgi:PAS domain-containing protein